MIQPLRRAAQVTWVLALLVLVGSIGVWLYQNPLQDVDTARRLGMRFVGMAVTPAFLGCVGLCLALGAGGAWAESRVRRSRQSFAQRPSLSPLAVVDADVALAVREMLVELQQVLRGYIQRTEPDMIAFVDILLDGAIRVGASDVHMHPLETGTRIAFRVHGVLEEVMMMPREHHPRLINRLKVLAKVVLFRSDRPQDGHFAISTAEGPADIRLSLLPTNHGESVALRIARSTVRLPELGRLGFPQGLLPYYQRLLDSPQGVIFVAGATGAGKTTTLYASLGYIKETRGELTRIATIEDPVEYDVPLFSQTQVNAEQGFTFAQGLRSVLRQDPNVIMVGEIRDAETARTAIQAGLSGHLLLTTVHASSSAGVFNRLIEMGVEPFLLASASVASISQRLVRALCPHCRVPTSPEIDELARLEASGLSTAGPFFAPAGCPRCAGSGYLGRAALYEVLRVSPAIRECITTKVPTSRTQDVGVQEGMVPLLAAGLERVNAGTTTLKEVFRVVG
ncbi:GspE/PulE family protein [Vitiosangium sp. GDMCC 1.1324]|uniref:GspE/PulE family protein n=1 Tax=Vitiosangium sp. (strain GDMCC 1.1324) TaxID=2138576 RepID=UPI000D35763C|nr:GspE/PulE family protein [Vitiosangium sp. GDMCC 1.1324]PTL76657.1 type II/IV secretion system protein [Vitiosangium sp. GDMCC 1.1324]